MSGAIQRWSGSPGRSRAVAYGGLVFTVATARDKSGSLRQQTADALGLLDQHLAEAGTDKSRLLSVTVYITNMPDKAEMNAAWMEWVDPANPPQRACIGATLDGQDLVEIVAVAAAG